MSNILVAAADMNEAKGETIYTVSDVLKVIKQHTFGCVVAGGYCRDSFFGVEPKDIDVAVYNFHPDDYAEKILLDNLWRQLEKLGVKNLSHFIEGGDEEYIVNDPRVHMVWNIPQLNLDLIFYNNCKSFTDVIHKFDFNINQFYLPSTVPDGTWDTGREYNPSLDEAPVYVGHYPVDELWQTKSDLTAERRLKMLNKFAAFYPNKLALIQSELYDDDFSPY